MKKSNFKKGQKIFARLVNGHAVNGTITEKKGKLFLFVKKQPGNILFPEDRYYYLSAIVDIN